MKEGKKLSGLSLWLKVKGCLRIILCAFSLYCAGADQVFPVFMKQDPGITVDGELDASDWGDIKHEFVFPDQIPPARILCLHGCQWKSKEDLSGSVKLAWRAEGLYVGAKVTDDHFYQTETGSGIFRGDHIELFIDTTPGIDASRDKLGAGQYQILLSPGNLNQPGSKPEARLVKPETRPLREVRIAARKTADGYTLEAMIPWKVIGMKKSPEIKERKVMALDIVLSDTDNPQPRQEKLLFAGRAPWAISRKRFLSGVFTDAKGTIPSGISSNSEIVLLASGKRIPSEDQLDFHFVLPALSENITPVLNFQAHNMTEKNSYRGYAAFLQIQVNGKNVTAEKLLDKPVRVIQNNGQTARLITVDNKILLPYIPDLSKMPKFGDKNYPFRDMLDMCRYRFSLAGLTKPGENTITFQVKSSKGVNCDVKLLRAAIEFVSRGNARPLRPAPTGKIPTFVPRKDFKTDYQITSRSGNTISFHVGKQKFVLESRFSTPAGKYVSGSNSYFKMTRKIEEKGELFLIRDTFTNLTGKDLPLMQFYEVTPASSSTPVRELRLCGLPVSPELTDFISSRNSSAFLALDHHGVGLFPLSDIFMVHSASYVKDRRKIGVADRFLVLRPGVSIETELAVVPVNNGDYFSFVNALRRELEMNYQVPGPLVYLPESWWQKQNTRGNRKKIKEFLDYRDAHLAWLGFRVHGPTIIRNERNNEKKAHARYAMVREYRPGILRSAYFHCFLDFTERTAGMYPDAEVHDKTGNQVKYLTTRGNVFIPTLENGMGRDTEKNLDYILKEFKNDMDFFYWDEFNTCKVSYSYNQRHWDGCSADIDLKTGRIIRKKTSLALLSYPWRLKMIHKIKQQFSMVMINGSFPVGKEMRKEKLIAFTEMAQPSNAARVHFSTPVGLGDHLTDDTELKCYEQMLEWLDYGLLYYWYFPKAKMTHHTLTRYMYPFTPMELGAGYLIGKERIITKVSGLWGWDDASRHEVHVFDQNGWEQTDFKAPVRSVNGKTFTELRLPEKWSAAIIRK